jgi:Domain of unknown function (DUF4338)
MAGARLRHESQTTRELSQEFVRDLRAHVPIDRRSRKSIWLLMVVLGRWAACFMGAAAWKLSIQDQFIGWNKKQREANLCYLANNLRFLILPWVRVKNLASYLLGASLLVLCAHWQCKYGHPVYLVETFVECERFRGTCYRAANWLLLGQTQGRGRNDRFHQLRDRSRTSMYGHCARIFASVSPRARRAAKDESNGTRRSP